MNLCKAYNFSDHVVSHKATLRVKQLQEREREREKVKMSTSVNYKVEESERQNAVH